MDAAQIEGHHLWREFLGAVSDQFSMGRFALPTHDFISELASDGCPATRCGCTKDPLWNSDIVSRMANHTEDFQVRFRSSLASSGYGIQLKLYTFAVRLDCHIAEVQDERTMF